MQNDFEFTPIIEVSPNDTKVLDFPFPHRWLASVRGGEKALMVYWNVIQLLNNSAILGKDYSEEDELDLHWFNQNVFEKWELPIFEIDN